MRVCFLTHYFPPEVGAPQTRIDLLARTLAARGAEVTVHTCFPHYPSGRIAAPYNNRPWLTERRGDVHVVRSAVYPAPNRGFTRRLSDHGSFALSSLATARLTGPADVVVAETPPLFTAAAGVAYAAAKRAACVIHVADRWPASAIELGMLRDRRAIAAASALERWVYRHADLVLAPTDGIVTALKRVPEAGAKVQRVWPVVDVTRFDPGTRDALDGPLRVLYAGTVGLAQGLDVLVQASALAGPEVVQTTIAGDGADADRIRALIRDRRIGNVRMLGALAADAIPGLYSECDASAVLLRDLPIFAGALPTKLLEAMAAGRPLLLAARGEAADLVSTARAGIVIEPGDPSALADACSRLRADPARRRALGQAGRRFAEARFGAQRSAERWLAALEESIRRRASSERATAHRSARAAAARCRAG